MIGQSTLGSRIGLLWLRLDPAWRHALGAWTGMRLVLLLLAVTVVTVYPGTLDPEAVFRQRIGIPPVEGQVRNAVWGVWLRFDTLWYIRYARDGLLSPAHPEYRAFWPLYPWLIRGLAPLLGGNHLIAALIISNLALIAALAVFYRLCDRELQPDVAHRAVGYMVLLPPALFFFAAYSEPLFLALSLAAFDAARRTRWGWAGVWVALAALSRPVGVFLLPAFGFEYLRQRLATRGRTAWRDRRWWMETICKAWPLLIAAAGAAFFPLYMALRFGRAEPLIVGHVGNAETVHRMAFPWQVLYEAVRSLAGGRFFAIQPFDLALTLLFVGLAAAAFRRLPAMYGLYMGTTLLFLLSRSIAQHPLIGASRYVGPLFPGYMVLGLAGRRPWVHRLILYPSVLVLAFFATEFMIGGFVG